eukprot:TRINITY_DN17404_c1_g1_i1.p1 TRINITY_DN17404_c1_g1~~TRINITY_DN17404_c1_g1_i1.p1  ORF type:complete len:282 (+),score=24.26 TRINITY_DN17404_c1_g1_i1:46-846(+)
MADSNAGPFGRSWEAWQLSVRPACPLAGDSFEISADWDGPPVECAEAGVNPEWMKVRAGDIVTVVGDYSEASGRVLVRSQNGDIGWLGPGCRFNLVLHAVLGRNGLNRDVFNPIAQTRPTSKEPEPSAKRARTSTPVAHASEPVPVPSVAKSVSAPANVEPPSVPPAEVVKDLEELFTSHYRNFDSEAWPAVAHAILDPMKPQLARDLWNIYADTSKSKQSRCDAMMSYIFRELKIAVVIRNKNKNDKNSGPYNTYSDWNRERSWK